VADDRTVELRLRPRPHQVIPTTDAGTVVAFGGRGSGKTWRLCSWLLQQALTYPQTTWGAVSQTWSDSLSILAEGEGGLRWHIEGNEEQGRPDLSFVLEGGAWDKAFNRSPGRMVLTFSNGSRVLFASADRPKSLRGKNLHGAVADEVAFWPEESYDMLRLATRLPLPDGRTPQILMGTTPNGINWLAERFLLGAPRPDVAFVGGAEGGTMPPDPPPSTFDNPHTDATWRQQLVGMYEGTELGRQELYGELLSLSGAIYKGLDPLLHTRAGCHERGEAWPAAGQADEVIAGQDLGTEHPSALIVLARVGERWHAVEEVVAPAATEADWHGMIAPTLDRWQPHRIYSDRNFPQTTTAQQRRGLPIVLAEKGPGSVLDGIRAVQQRLSDGTLVIDAEACPRLWREMRNYRWATGADGRPTVPERPAKLDDDACDAMRYAVFMTSQRRRLLFS
jgi:phage terminase large subunit-like protein